MGWKDDKYSERIENKKCMISQDVGYQIFAISLTFYIPVVLIFALYFKIYQVARKRINKNAKGKTDVSATSSTEKVCRVNVI